MSPGKVVSFISQATRKKAERAVCPCCGGDLKTEARWPDSTICRCPSCSATVHISS